MTEVHWQIGRLIEVRRLSEAKPLLQRLFSSQPDDPEAHVLAARIALMEDNAVSAGEHVAHALAGNPAHQGARLLRFFLLLGEHRYPEAEQTIISLLREDPSDADLLAYYARLMLYTANLEKARALTTEAIRHDPEHHEARVVAVLLSTVRGDHSLAREQLADLVREDPEGRQLAWTLFTVLCEQRRSKEALLVGQQLLRDDPDNKDLAQLLIDLRTTTHWVSLPAWPLNRWGWAASGGIWIGALMVIMLLQSVAPRWAGLFMFSYLAWVIYTWTYRPVLRRWIAWRGI